jgi:DNA-binding XRE family transcriptional regulator
MDFTNEDVMSVRTVTLDGREYVLIPRKQWEAMSHQSEGMRGTRSQNAVKLPPLVKGMYTIQHVRISLANKIAAQRKGARLTQAQLARLAGVRVETISRLENGLHTPGIRTFAKIEQALKKATKRSAA